MAWMAGGRQSRRSVSAGTRPARSRRACDRSAKPAWPPSRNRCTHLCPVWRLIPYVRLNPATSRRPPASQSSMNLLRSATSPVSFQGILEVSTIRSDRSVNNQLGSYSLPPGGARRSAAEALRQPPDKVLSPLESGGAARRPTRVDSGC